MTDRDAVKADPTQLRLRVPEDARALFTRVRDWESENRGSYFELADDDRQAGQRLVDLGLAFYSMDRDHIGLLRHTDVV